MSTVMKIHGVQDHRSMVVDRIGLLIGGDERIVLKISGLGCVQVA